MSAHSGESHEIARSSESDKTCVILTTRSLLADMCGRGVTPTLFVLGLVPLMQARLLGSEIGLYNIFNSPDSAWLSGNLRLSIPAFGWFSAAFFFVFFGALIALFHATSGKALPRFERMTLGQAAWLGLSLFLCLAAVELAVFCLIAVLLGTQLGDWTQGMVGLAIGLAVGGIGCSFLFFVVHDEAQASWHERRLRADARARRRRKKWPKTQILVAVTIVIVVASACLFPEVTAGLPEWAIWPIGPLAILAAIWLVDQRTCRWQPPCYAILGSLAIGLATNAAALLTVLGLVIALWMVWHRAEVEGRAALAFCLLAGAAVGILVPEPGEPTLIGRAEPTTGKRAHQQAMAASDCAVASARQMAVSDGGASTPRGIALGEVLTALQARSKAPNPKVIAVIASGGGYRATFWAAAVLDAIRARGERDPRLSTFARDVRILTGASGGMVALAYMAESIVDGNWDGEHISRRIANDVASSRAYAARSGIDNTAATDRHTIDSLHPILQSLVSHDLASAFGIPQALKHLPLDLSWWTDRGVALEAQWPTLSKTFGEVLTSEACGERPILVLSPMISQSGQPLIVSNLNLPAPDVPKDLAVELRGRYPTTFSEVSIARAVRANASFPRVSPLLRISPDALSEHVTDAGFSDNLGMDMLVRIFHHSEVRKWMEDNKATLIVVQIRAFPSSNLGQPGASSSEPACKGSEAGWPQWLQRLYFQMTSTIQSVLNARTTGNLHRAELQLDLLRRSYPKVPIEDVVFENHSDVSMSWLLPSTEQECLRNEMEKNQAAELEKLAKFLSAP
jgi:hypothetical protein